MRSLKATTAQAVVCILVMCVTASHAQEPCDTAGPTVAAIRQVAAEIDTAFATADAALLGGLVTEDAVWMAPDEPLIRGRAAVEERYRAVFGELHDRFSEVAHSMEIVEVCVCDEWAVSRGSYRLTLTLPNVAQPIVITGKNMHTYRRQHDGSWLIASDIWNADAPVRRGPPE